MRDACRLNSGCLSGFVILAGLPSHWVGQGTRHRIRCPTIAQRCVTALSPEGHDGRTGCGVVADPSGPAQVGSRCHRG
jgi:hypothetical protein